MTAAQASSVAWLATCGWMPTAASTAPFSASFAAARDESTSQPGTRIRSTPPWRAASSTVSRSASNALACRCACESTSLKRTGSHGRAGNVLVQAYLVALGVVDHREPALARDLDLWLDHLAAQLGDLG